ncbi:hypothetical protein ACFVTX_14905 [Agromyces sp. NPDC058136]|uniref:hypothetical protein n=1 Tax=Agromyces sp. NPDC058136 TaxID=3346354 RepID=UPI0036DE451A
MAENPESQALPEVIQRLIARLQYRSKVTAENVITASAFRPNDQGVLALKAAQRLVDLGQSTRAILTAYAHAVQTPRPNLTVLATAQEVSPSGLRRRYDEATVEAIRGLLEARPNLEAVRKSTRGLDDRELFGVSRELDEILLEAGVDRPTGSLEESIAIDIPAAPFLGDVEALVAQGPVGEDEGYWRDHLQNDATMLLGRLVATLRGLLSSSSWTDGWVDPSQSVVKYEWAGGAHISQVLASILPQRAPGTKPSEHPESGIFGLRLVEARENHAELVWFANDHEIKLILRRYPAS